jgi:UDP-N-acetyl-D-glucosamine dehydrogenase
MDLQEKIRTKRATIAVVGLGYVGLPLAVEYARSGYHVVGLDADAERARAVNEGSSYIRDVDEVVLKEAVKSGRLRATTSPGVLREADVITVCVPTPLTAHKVPDTSYIERAVDAAVPFLRRGQLVILESTTYPGTTQEVVVPRIEAAGLVVGRDVHVAFSPERIDPGNATYKVRDIPKVVGGVTPACAEAARAVYETGLGTRVFVVSSPAAAEMTKLLENIYRIVNVSLVNEVAMLCDRMGVDVWEVVEAAKTKPFGFTPFYPGPGMGGHCIPVDAFYLSWKAKQYDFSTRFVELAGEINDAMPEYVVRRAAEALNAAQKPVRGSRVLLLGVAYKRDVPDVRESPAIRVADLLSSQGADVRYHDPHVPVLQLARTRLESRALTDAEITQADIVIVLTDHHGVDYDAVARGAKLVYDTRNALKARDAPHIHHLGAGETPAPPHGRG